MCEFLKDGKCLLVEKMCGYQCNVDETTCNVCKSQKNPMSENHVTASLCIKSTIDNKGNVRDVLNRFAPLLKKEIKVKTEEKNDEWPLSGAGTQLKLIISKLGFSIVDGCKCIEHARAMNDNGIEWCEENIDTIVGWLRQEAERRKLYFSNVLAKIIVKRAINRAKKYV